MQPTVTVKVNISVAWADASIRVKGAGRAYTVSGFPPTKDKLHDAAILLRLAADKLDKTNDTTKGGD